METKVTQEPASAPALARNMGLAALIFYGVGDMMGAGIYGLIGKAAGQAGNTVWLTFLASMVAALLTGLSYAALGSRHPRAAGAAYFTQRAFGKKFLAYVIGLVVLASGLTSMAAASRVIAGYVQGLAGGLPPQAVPVIIIGFILGLTVINLWGIREASWFNILCTMIEMSGLLLVIAVGFKYWGRVNYLDFTSQANPAGVIALPLVLQGAVLTFYSFVGFEDMINVAEEVKNPRRNLPLALLIALSITTLLYMAVAITAVSVIPHAELAASPQPLVDVVRRAAPAIPAWFYSAVAIFAVANTALLNYVMGSRIVYGMARQGLLPAPLGRVHPRRRTPHVAILILMAIVLTMALTGGVAALAKATSVLLLGVFTVVNLAQLVLGRRPGEPKGFMNVPSVAPIGGAIVCLAMLAHAKQAEVIISMVILGVIVGLYFVVKPKTGVSEDAGEG